MKVRYGRSMDDRLMPSDSIYVAQSRIPNAGRGVFAAVGIKEGEVIERCPVIEMMEPDIRARLNELSLRNYYFTWGEERERAAVALGYGSIYNHSFAPNACYIKRIPERRIEFIALKDIVKNEEILVNYNGDPADQSPLWTGAIDPE